MGQLNTQVPLETWLPVSWEEFIQITESPDAGPDDGKVKAYYYNGRMRLENMAALGNPHSRDHYILLVVIGLFTGFRAIDIDGHDNCSYRKLGYAEVQPDSSFYVGEKAQVIPWDAKVIDLDVYPPPDLVIEIADSSLADDKGEKRLLYEALGIREYWIVDVKNTSVWAFAVADGGSRRIDCSQVLAGLEISVLEEAFRRSRTINHGQVTAWLIRQFQAGMAS
jgi:Uma2 family endonuclease